MPKHKPRIRRSNAHNKVLPPPRLSRPVAIKPVGGHPHEAVHKIEHKAAYRAARINKRNAALLLAARTRPKMLVRADRIRPKVQQDVLDPPEEAVPRDVVQPASRGGVGARITGSAPGSGGIVSVQGDTKPFEPAFDHEVIYGEVPKGGDSMTLKGPLRMPEFLEMLHLATNWNIIPSQASLGISLNFLIQKVTPQQALEVLKAHKIHYEFDTKTNFLRLMTAQEWLEEEYGDREAHEFEVKHADITYIESVLGTLLSTVGRIIADPRTGRIYVWDTKDNITQMAKMVKEFDVALEKKEFNIQHADLADIEIVLGALLSPVGSLFIDERTAQVHAWDLPVRLTQMQEAVDTIDVLVEMRSYDIKYADAYVVADSIADAELLSPRGLIQVDPRYNTLHITDLPVRLDRAAEAIKLADRELETRTWVIKYAPMEFITAQVEVLIPIDMGEIVINEEVHQITATGLTSRLDKLDELIAVWDIQREQVSIEAYIVEMSDSVAREFNINWSYFGGNNGTPFSLRTPAGFGGTGVTGASPFSIGQLPVSVPRVNDAGLPLLDFTGTEIIERFSGNNLGLTLDYLDSKDKATILASPQLTVIDGQEATFQNATRVPYTSQTTNFNPSSLTGRGATNTNQIAFIDVGTILTVTPRISDAETIIIDVSATDSTFEDKIIVTNDTESTVPQTTERKITTQVRVKSGETIVLGGLRRDRAAKRETRIPLLGDLPGIGRLFRFPNKSSAHNMLLIFITITIVDDLTHPEAILLAKADDDINSTSRHNQKDFFGRMKDRMTSGKNEVDVSIGQNGDLMLDGEIVTLRELRKSLNKIKNKSGVVVVIRKNPRAPEEISKNISSIAQKAGLKVEYDDLVIPFVPSIMSEEDSVSEGDEEESTV